MWNENNLINTEKSDVSKYHCQRNHELREAIIFISYIKCNLSSVVCVKEWRTENKSKSCGKGS